MFQAAIDMMLFKAENKNRNGAAVVGWSLLKESLETNHPFFVSAHFLISINLAVLCWVVFKSLIPMSTNNASALFLFLPDLGICTYGCFHLFIEEEPSTETNKVEEELQTVSGLMLKTIHCFFYWQQFIEPSPQLLIFLKYFDS